MAAGTWTDPIAQLKLSGNVVGGGDWNNILNDIAALEQSLQVVYVAGPGGGYGTGIGSPAVKVYLERFQLTYTKGVNGYKRSFPAGIFNQVFFAYIANVDLGGATYGFTGNYAVSSSPDPTGFQFTLGSTAGEMTTGFTPWVTLIAVGT